MNRAPAVAGRFYPSNPTELATQIGSFIGDASGAAPAIAIVAPHAGIMYSGAIAGSVYATVEVPDVVIALCPNHTGRGARTAIMSSGSWEIPGRTVMIDEASAGSLRALAQLNEDDRAHAGEHALEVHLPFLVHRNPNVRIVPVCVGPIPIKDCERIGRALATVVAQHEPRPLIVASTDMSHYIPALDAERLDRMAIDAIEELDARQLLETVSSEGITMCGVIPTAITLAAAQTLGATSATLVRYGNSGETSGDYHRVVGYAGLVIRDPGTRSLR